LGVDTVCRTCIVPGLGRDIGCRRKGSGFVRLVVAVVVAAVEADVEVEVAVAEVAPDKLAAEAGTEAGSSSTYPSQWFGH
jgi:hypothetical protein